MSNRELQIRSLDEHRSNDDLAERTPAELIQMVWPLTQQAWAFTRAADDETNDAQSRLPRHVVRLRRRGG